MSNRPGREGETVGITFSRETSSDGTLTVGGQRIYRSALEELLGKPLGDASDDEIAAVMGGMHNAIIDAFAQATAGRELKPGEVIMFDLGAEDAPES